MLFAVIGVFLVPLLMRTTPDFNIYGAKLTSETISFFIQNIGDGKATGVVIHYSIEARIYLPEIHYEGKVADVNRARVLYERYLDLLGAGNYYTIKALEMLIRAENDNGILEAGETKAYDIGNPSAVEKIIFTVTCEEGVSETFIFDF